MSSLNASNGVTIPKAVVEEMQLVLTAEYKRVFGDEAVTNVHKETMSRDAMIQRYVKNIHFWKAQKPQLSPSMSIHDLAKHAICENAVRNLSARCAEYGILEEMS